MITSHQHLLHSPEFIIRRENMNAEQLLIPIYLNQKNVFDMLAVIEDGFSQMSTIQKSSANNKELGAEVGGEIGSSNIFAFLGVKLKSNIKRGETKNEGSAISQNKVHTPASLFEKLLEFLDDNKLIYEVDSDIKTQNLTPGNFVRFTGKLSKNPVISVMESIQKLMELAFIFDGKSNQSNKTNKGKGGDNKLILSQMKALSDSLKSGNMFDLICKIDGTNIRAVLPVYIDYFYNQNMSEIIDGQYKILGKVIRVINSNSESINLLRNTSFSMMQNSMFETLFSSLEGSQIEGFDIPQIESKICEPAIMAIPIAIYT